MRKAPIFIFGLPRSGTTLLRTVLNCHPHIACGPEAPWLADHETGSVMSLYQRLTTGDFNFSENFCVPDSVALLRVRELVDGLFGDFAAQQGKIRWAHKTPDDCIYIKFFTHLFPDAKYLYIVRHPLDVALSTTRIPEDIRGVSPWHEKNLVLEHHCAVQNTLFNSALRWQRWNDKVRQGLKEVECLPLAYEDLVTEPLSGFAEIFDFLGEPFSPELLDYAKFEPVSSGWERGAIDVRKAGHIVTSRIGRWKEELSPDETRALLSVSGLGSKSLAAVHPDAAGRLACVREMESDLYRFLVDGIDSFGGPLGLRPVAKTSKAWEFPWLWNNGLARIDWRDLSVVDIGGGMSPVPWFLAMKGARVTLIDTDPQGTAFWETLRKQLKVDVRWKMTASEALPLEDGSADIVIGCPTAGLHLGRKEYADEIARILKPQGLLALSFEFSEPGTEAANSGPNGFACTPREFEESLWFHPAFGNTVSPAWNVDEIASFREWNLGNAAGRDHAAGAAVLTKRAH
ncbi:MAG: sulfotransferase [Opitutaceae bacterium]